MSGVLPSYVRQSSRTWATMLAVVGALAACSGCSESSAPRGELVLDGTPPTFLIERAGDGMCEFDYRGQMSSLDVASGEPGWTVEVPYPGPVDMALVGDTIIGRSVEFAGGLPTVFALSASDGSPLWQREVARSPGLPWAPVPVDEVVVTSDGDFLVALSISDGAERWRREAGPEPTVTISGSDVAVGRRDRGVVELLDAESGSVRWSTSLTEGTGGIPDVVMTATSVISGAYEGELVAFDRETGNEIWSAPPVPGRYWSAVVGMTGDTIVVSDGVLTSGDAPAVDPAISLRGFDVETGEQTWWLPVDEHHDETTAVVGDAVVTFDGSEVSAIEGDTGEVGWTMSTPDLTTISSPADGVVVLTRRDRATKTTRVDVVNVDLGDILWSTTLPVASTGPATIAGDLVLIGGGIGVDSDLVDSLEDGLVFALALDDGRELWRSEHRDSARSRIVVDGDAALLLSSDGLIFCD